MAKAKRRKSNYKFTEKTQSKRGICGFVLSLISLGIFAYVVENFTNSCCNYYRILYPAVGGELDGNFRDKTHK